MDKKRKHKREVLTEEKLDDIESWSYTQKIAETSSSREWSVKV
jgi:hypothetical protein